MKRSRNSFFLGCRKVYKAPTAKIERRLSPKAIFLCGGAGFLGSHLAKALLEQEPGAQVAIYDNFSSGKLAHFDGVRDNKNLKIFRSDIKDLKRLSSCMRGADIVYHLASNPDISKGLTHPDIDFWEGTYLTNNILEAMRANGVKRLLYASGSGVYGDTGRRLIQEDYSPTIPISTYGASKLSGEALIAAYCHMFDIRACAFRFANIVGANQTHGVILDFIRKLMRDDTTLSILGNGRQSKSYIHARDAVGAMRLVERKMPEGFGAYNVAAQDHLSVKEIADIVIRVLGVKKARYVYSGGERGWKGDVPVVRLDSAKIRRLGWRNQYSSKEAVTLAAEDIYKKMRGTR